VYAVAVLASCLVACTPATHRLSVPAPSICGEKLFALESASTMAIARCDHEPCPTEVPFMLTSCSNAPIIFRSFEVCGPLRRGTCRSVMAPRVLAPHARLSVRVTLDLFGSYEVVLDAGMDLLSVPVTLVDTQEAPHFENCMRCRGKWALHSLGATRESCNCRTRDGGKPCIASSECEARCEIPYNDALKLFFTRKGWRRGDPSAPRGSCSEFVNWVSCKGWLRDEHLPDGSIFERVMSGCKD
jgi:hypothetical protein